MSASSGAPSTSATATRPPPGRGSDDVLRPDRLDQPLRWKRPRRIFVNSMSDLFHKDVPDEFIAKVFAVMALAPQHQFQVLTKRHGRMRSLLNNYGWWTSVVMHALELGDNPSPTQTLPDGRCALSNVWLGVSVEDQHAADLRIPALLETPAAVRFLSMRAAPRARVVPVGTVGQPRHQAGGADRSPRRPQRHRLGHRRGRVRPWSSPDAPGVGA